MRIRNRSFEIRQNTALILVFILLMNSLAPLIFPAKSFAELAPGEKISDLLGSKILICTPDGFEYIDVTDLQNGDLPASDLASGDHCPLCVLSNSVEFTPPVTEAVYHFIPEKSFVRSKSVNQISFNNFSERPSFPRAPPLAS